MQLPDDWHQAIKEAARSRRFSISDLVRQLIRDFLLNRYDDDDRSRLE